jgi:hypothetical protein
MGTFGKLISEDGLKHISTINTFEANKNHRFFVKCKLADSNNIIGNDGDQIRFTVDSQPPETGIFSGKYSDVNYAYRNYPLNFGNFPRIKISYPNNITPLLHLLGVNGKDAA